MTLLDKLKERMPYNFYYQFQSSFVVPEFENEKEIEQFVKVLGWENDTSFIFELKKKDEEGFIKELDANYNFYYNKSKDCTQWLEHTSKIIRREIKNRYFILALDNWLKSKTAKKKGDTESLWFQVGLKFATGEIYTLLKKNENNFTTVADILGNRNFRPYISESISQTNANDKNIFSNKRKVRTIKDYCLQNSIIICEEFLKQIPSD